MKRVITRGESIDGKTYREFIENLEHVTDLKVDDRYRNMYRPRILGYNPDGDTYTIRVVKNSDNSYSSNYDDINIVG